MMAAVTGKIPQNPEQMLLARRMKAVAAAAKLIDHTYLADTASLDDQQREVLNLVQEAVNMTGNKNFPAVAGGICIRPHLIDFAVDLLQNLDPQNLVKLVTVFSFPKGNNSTEDKVREAVEAMGNFADGGDMVINVDHVTGQNMNLTMLHNDIVETGRAIFSMKGTEFKVIIEAARLRDIDGDVAVEAAALAVKGAFLQLENEFGPGILKQCWIKTSTGYYEPIPGTKKGASIPDIKIMASTVGPEISIKPAGGIRDLNTFLAMVTACRETGVQGKSRPSDMIRIGMSGAGSRAVMQSILTASENELAHIEKVLDIKPIFDSAA